MEDVLAVYEQATHPNRARICFDERPCQLLENVIAPLLIKPGKVAKEDNDGAARAVYP
ncbi:hypothetical protein [Spirosoma endbachense]|uniref:hypothetical protein n=1 Tax=Spirosoma endbachense TaxID=2666025 RepID=UPI001390C3D8|nr:hypothetical protein [Spirosoma endbachense]